MIAFAAFIVISNPAQTIFPEVQAVLVGVRARRNRFRYLPYDHFNYGAILADFFQGSDGRGSHYCILTIGSRDVQLWGRRTDPHRLIEIGDDMSRFGPCRYLACWAAFRPGNNESASKRRTGRGNSAIRSILCESGAGADGRALLAVDVPPQRATLRQSDGRPAIRGPGVRLARAAAPGPLRRPGPRSGVGWHGFRRARPGAAVDRRPLHLVAPCRRARPGAAGSVQRRGASLVRGDTRQMRSAYSAIVRSDENGPIPATLAIAIRSHASRSRYSASTRCWVCT